MAKGAHMNLIVEWLKGSAIWLIVVAALLTAVGVQQLRVAGLKVDLATEKQARSDEDADRLRVALKWQQYVDKKEEAHATSQQLKDNEYAKAYTRWQADRVVDRASNERLRGVIETFTASNRGAGESDAAFIKRTSDRLKAIGGLLAGGTGLVTESIGIIERRDLEVARLSEQIKIDRLACSRPLPS